MPGVFLELPGPLMNPSAYNRAIPLKDDKILLVNTFSGALDVVPREVVDLATSKEPAHGHMSDDIAAYLAERRYLLPEDLNEKREVASVYDQLSCARREVDHLQAVLVLGFGCNLRCTYCWQRQQIDASSQSQVSGILSARQADLALQALPALCQRMGFAVDGTVVQLFGGEPLLPAHQPVAAHILESCASQGWRTQITTNGSFLGQFREAILAHGASEVQVTLDGPASVHESRRVGSRFDELMSTLDDLLAETDTKVKLRVNVDPSNLADLPALAAAIMDRQWYANRNFYAYLAPLRDGCGLGDDLLEQRPKLLADLLELAEASPRMGLFDMLGWDGFQSAWAYANLGRLPFPKVFVCDAGRNQFVFSPSGLVHTCAEEAHNPESSVGRYDPELRIDEAALRDWHGPTPLSLERCDGCSLLPQCGGGCRLLDRRPGARAAFCRAVGQSFDAGLRSALTKEYGQ